MDESSGYDGKNVEEGSKDREEGEHSESGMIIRYYKFLWLAIEAAPLLWDMYSRMDDGKKGRIKMSEEVKNSNQEGIQLSKEEELAASRLAGSIMGKLCFAGAKAFKGTGFLLEKSTSVTATGLRMAAAGIETGGKVSSDFCYKQAEKLENKRAEYEADTQEVENAQKKLNDLLSEMKEKGITPVVSVAQ